jgi:hypothetical protein
LAREDVVDDGTAGPIVQAVHGYPMANRREAGCIMGLMGRPAIRPSISPPAQTTL